MIELPKGPREKMKRAAIGYIAFFLLFIMAVLRDRSSGPLATGILPLLGIGIGLAIEVVYSRFFGFAIVRRDMPWAQKATRRVRSLVIVVILAAVNVKIKLISQNSPAASFISFVVIVLIGILYGTIIEDEGLLVFPR